MEKINRDYYTSRISEKDKKPKKKKKRFKQDFR